MKKIILDTQLMFIRVWTNRLRNPIWIFIGLFQPVLYLLLFMPLLNGMIANPLKTFVPGLLVMTALYEVAGAGYSMIYDLRSGVIERFRVTPVSRLAFLLGLILNDGLGLLLQSTTLILLAVWMGLRVPVAGVALLLALVLIVGVAMAALAYGLALAVKDENGLASITNTFLLPIMLLSGILLPLTNAPTPLKIAAAVNPLSHIVNAARAVISADYGQPVVWLGFSLAMGLAVICISWATRMIRSATA
jgi:ABC-2 type transport system permease protein